MRFSAQAILTFTDLQDADGIAVAKAQGYVQVNTVLKRSVTDGEGNTVEEKLPFEKRIAALTVDKAKGLESDIVILINCETGKYGFPAELSDDAILNLLLSGDDQYSNGEERRAFCVALTRAKEKFVFLADKSKRSKFLREIHAENAAQEREALRCRKCEAEMRFIKNVKSKFSGLN